MFDIFYELIVLCGGMQSQLEVYVVSFFKTFSRFEGMVLACYVSTEFGSVEKEVSKGCTEGCLLKFLVNTEKCKKNAAVYVNEL